MYAFQKTLIYSAEALHFAQKGNTFGFTDSSPQADIVAMQKRKKQVIAEFADYRKNNLRMVGFLYSALMVS